MRNEQRRLAIAILAIAITSGVATTASSSTTANVTTTKVETMDPWTAAGTPKAGLRVAGEVQGTCWTSSIAVSSSNAYRCMTRASLIYDPCFAPETQTFTQLACMAAPWGEVTRLDLTARIPKSAKHANGKPWMWAEVLGNGAHCITVTGTGVEVDKVQLSYYCEPGLGWTSSPDRNTVPWTVRYARSVHAKTLVTERVATAWN